MDAKHKSRFGAVILAAGMSSRMEEPKQLPRHRENTLLDQVLENVRGSRVNDIVPVLGHEAKTIQERKWHQPQGEVPNFPPSQAA